MTKRSSFPYFKTQSEVIRLAVKMKIRFPIWIRNVDDRLREGCIDIRTKTVTFWWPKFGPIFVVE